MGAGLWLRAAWGLGGWGGSFRSGREWACGLRRAPWAVLPLQKVLRLGSWVLGRSFRSGARISVNSQARRARNFSSRRQTTNKRFSPVSLALPGLKSGARRSRIGSPSADRLAACDVRLAPGASAPEGLASWVLCLEQELPLRRNNIAPILIFTKTHDEPRNLTAARRAQSPRVPGDPRPTTQDPGPFRPELAGKSGARWMKTGVR